MSAREVAGPRRIGRPVIDKALSIRVVLRLVLVETILTDVGKDIGLCATNAWGIASDGAGRVNPRPATFWLGPSSNRDHLKHIRVWRRNAILACGAAFGDRCM